MLPDRKAGRAAGSLIRGVAGSLVAFSLVFAVAEVRSATTKITVVDGDTLELDGRIFDLEGIDAPELGQTCLNGNDEWKCGLESALALKKVIALNPVTCEPRDPDQTVLRGRCKVNEADDLARIQVEVGYALADPGAGPSYQDAEAMAKSASLGLWRGPFEPPWEWRRRFELSGPAAALERCVVKGKITESGDKIYLIPSDAAYADQVVDTGRGERLFCSDDQARLEGWSRTPR